MPPSRSDLIALARKYRTLSELRRATFQLTSFDERRLARQLAREFPGALRELDIMPLAEIERRADALAAAARGGPAEAWMEWMVAYHRTMRAALAIQRLLLGRRTVREERAIVIAFDVSHESGVRCDVEFVRELASPSRGRIHSVVFRRLSIELGATPSAIQGALFADARPGRS
jgi:hypothetical protein